MCVCVHHGIRVCVYIYIHIYELRYIFVVLDVSWVEDSCLSMSISRQRKELNLATTKAVVNESWPMKLLFLQHVRFKDLLALH